MVILSLLLQFADPTVVRQTVPITDTPVVSAGQTLWKNIAVGMTYAEVQRLYPAVKGKVHHKPGWIKVEGAAKVGGCTPNVTVNFSKAGVVAAVWMSPRPGGFDHCTEEALDALRAKYGKPDSIDLSSQAYVWFRDGVAIRFTRTGFDDWTIVYEPIASADV